MTKCRDCYFKDAEKEGFFIWCEDCFEKGLAKDLEEHSRNFFKTEFDDLNKTGTEPLEKER